jgi:uncharacterized protein
MITLRIAVTLFLLSIATVTMAAPASENSIKQLLAVTQVYKFSDNIKAQINTYINNFMLEELKGKNPTQKQQQAVTKMKNRISAIVQRELAWEKIEPMYIRLYKESFTEEEIAGMLSFYQTKAGNAVVNKMPVLIQKSTQEMQKAMIRTTPEMNKIEKDFINEMNAASKQ